MWVLDGRRKYGDIRIVVEFVLAPNRVARMPFCYRMCKIGVSQLLAEDVLDFMQRPAPGGNIYHRVYRITGIIKAVRILGERVSAITEGILRPILIPGNPAIGAIGSIHLDAPEALVRGVVITIGAFQQQAVHPAGRKAESVVAQVRRCAVHIAFDITAGIQIPSHARPGSLRLSGDSRIDHLAVIVQRQAGLQPSLAGRRPHRVRVAGRAGETGHLKILQTGQARGLPVAGGDVENGQVVGLGVDDIRLRIHPTIHRQPGLLFFVEIDHVQPAL